MSDDELTQNFQQLRMLQLHTLTKVTRLQALLYTQEDLITAFAAAHDFNAEQLKAQLVATYRIHHASLMKELKTRLFEAGLAVPKSDDAEWWDRDAAKQ